MNRTLIPLLVVASLFGLGIPAADAKTPRCERTKIYIPIGWCEPTRADYRGDWLRFKKETPIPFHISGYFNGDGQKDEAWILFDEHRKNWGVFVFLNQGEGLFTTLQIDDTRFEDLSPQTTQLQLLDNTVHETACGKGYWECAQNEPAKVKIKNNGFLLSPYEQGGAQIVYWEDGQFKKVFLND
jgi:hypothetical protein